MLKSTMQDLADAVGVSRITVWKALNDREGVSPRTKKRIQQKAAEMGLTDTEIQMEKIPEKETGRDEAEERTFSVVVSRPESSAFWMQIIHHIAKELARSRINLMYTYMPSFYSEGYTLPASVKNVDGLIVLNIYDARLLHMLNELPLPKVFLDTVPGMHPPALHGDLVLIEGRTCIREITRRLIDSGRTRLGFVGDKMNHSLEITSGVLAEKCGQKLSDFFKKRREQKKGEKREKNLPLDASLCLTAPLSLRAHYEEISAFLDGLPELPQAIVCASDFIAHFDSRYLTESGRKTPKGFLLTGFDNNAEYGNVADKITTVHVETSALGKRLANKLLFRADHPQMPPEVCYITTEIVYRGPLAAETEK